MLLRALLATAALAAGVVLSARLLVEPPPTPPSPETPSGTAPSSLAIGNGAAAAILVSRVPARPRRAAPGAPPVYARTLTVGRGDTLARLLAKAGVGRADAHAAIAALAGLYAPRRIRPGQELTLRFRGRADGAGADRFLGLTLAIDFARRVRVARTANGGFDARRTERALVRRPAWAGGTIRSSLFDDAVAAGLPAAVVVELIRLYSWDVDFQRDIRAGDSFEVVFERFFDAAGSLVHSGTILGAVMTLGGRRHPVFRFTGADGRTDYFDAAGRSVRKALMRTPIDGARLSSRFGRRRHPVLGYTRMHRGIDFAAPRGTPVYAAGKGTLTYAGRNGAYGRYVRIRHNARYATAYAHLSRIARGLGRGRRVDQGQVIGLVGSSGRSTGPHLHYEILLGGRQVNPLKVKMPSGRRLAGAELARFQVVRAELERRARALASAAELAGRGD